MDGDEDASGVRRELTAGEGGRVDSVVASAWPDVSRARIQRLIAEGMVTVNGTIVRKSSNVAEGALIAVSFPKRQPVVSTAAESVVVLFEDDDLIVIDKPSGTVVHDSPSNRAPSVVGWFQQKYADLAAAFDVDRPGVVHRLDRDTTGVLVLAKKPEAQGRLSKSFEVRDAHKKYLALCSGVPEVPKGMVDAAIGRDPVDRTRMTILKHGRDARTLYEVVASADGKALIEASPETGRTHQIRVHLAAIGAPVVGDRTYGREAKTRQLLHAWQLTIPHPAGGSLEVTAGVPRDFQDAAEQCGFGREVMRYCEPSPPVRHS